MLLGMDTSEHSITEELFDDWNEKKKELTSRPTRENLFFYEREMWWCSLGLNIGVEINGKHENYERPVLIIKKFNSSMIWILPLTSKERNSPHYMKIKHTHGTSWVSLAQIKTVSTKRLLRKIGMISIHDFQLVLRSVSSSIMIEPRIAAGLSEAEATNRSILDESSTESSTTFPQKL